MANWKHKLDVSDIFHIDEFSITEKGTKISERIKSSPWFEELYYKEDLEDLLESLSEVEDVEDFDYLWNEIYDIFDAERVWVTTR